MTVSKPSKFPQWSTNTDGTDHNVTNVDSGTNNAIEPSSDKKLLGWDYKEAPAYSNMNWLHRLCDQWIRWFDQQEQISKKFSISGNCVVTFPSSINSTFNYVKDTNGIVKLWWTDMFGLTSGVNHGSVATPLPAAIRPAGNHMAGWAVGYNASSGLYIPTSLYITTTGDLTFSSFDGATTTTTIVAGCIDYNV